MRVSRMNTGFGIILLAVSLILVMMIPNYGETAERQTFRLRVVAGHPYTPGNFWIKSLEDFFCREVEKRVLEKTQNYKVEMKGHYGGTLAKLTDCLDSVEKGLADIGFQIPIFEMSKLEPMNFSMWVPFSPPEMPKAIKAAEKTINHFPLFNELLAKYKQRRIGTSSFAQPSYQIISKFPIKTMDDLRGKKIGHGGPMLPWLSALGATSVRMAWPEVYTSMDTGVLDGYSMPANIVVALKIYDVGKYLTLANFGATAFVSGFISANIASWNKLPKEVQDILNQVGSEYTWDVVKRSETLEKEAIESLKNAKVSIYTLPEEERARWAKALDDARVTAKPVAACKAHGFPAEEIATSFIKAIEEEGYKFPYPITVK